MRRRVEDMTGRPDSSSGNVTLPASTTPIVGHGSSGPVSFVRLPTTTARPSPVAPIPVTSTASLAIHEQTVHPGYGPGRIEMHPISAFTTNLSVAPSNMTGVGVNSESSRPVINTVARADPAMTSTTQPSPPVRQRVLSNPGVTHQVVITQQSNAASVTACATLNSQIAGQFQRLKVEDALSYLDKVKLRFGRQPQVYNDFLDIMKEFKSQSIDTPGVIARVSTLFRGNPELIVGFNTFLPPGYKIEVQSNEMANSGGPIQQTTVVHTPQGIHHHFTTTTTPQPASPPVSLIQQNAPIKQEPSVEQDTSMPKSIAVGPPISSCMPIVIPNSPIQVSSPVSTTSSTNSTAAAEATGATESSSMPTQLNAHGNVQLGPTVLQIGLPQANPQPVEFNHAINYVNKIKSRFSSQPEIYKQFLDILHTYQKEQKYMKEGGSIPRSLTDAEVYERVAKLFKNESDLLDEFSQFLPDATNNTAEAAVSNIMDQYKQAFDKGSSSEAKESSGPSENEITFPSTSTINLPSTSHSNIPKRTRIGDSAVLPPTKRIRQGLRDGSVASVGKQMTLAEHTFFEKVRKALKTESAYQNFIRCMDCYIHGALTKMDLLSLINPFLGKFPDLHKWFVDFVGADDAQMPISETSLPTTKQERVGGDLAMEIDYTTCKRLGASYCALPKTFTQPECSGRSNLCKEVLNDTWVSFPSWSEDSTFVTSKKTQFEEYIYRCEDERFELDMVLETNTSTIKLLTSIEKTIEKMSARDAHNFTLNENLNGTAMTVYRRAISRIYGEKADDIIIGLRRNPVIAVPLVLRRLKSKDEDWREAQKGFHKSWREINEKYYLKSLDPQGISFKQTDMKLLRSKSLINEVETLYDERHERSDAGGHMECGPHIKLPYLDRAVMDDAANLIIHHVRRQSAIHKDDKAKIKQLVRHFIPDLLFHSRLELSDDERDLEDQSDDQMDVDSDNSSGEKKRSGPTTEANGNSSNGSTSTAGSCKRKTRSNKLSSVGGGKLAKSGSISRQNSNGDPAEEDLPLINGESAEVSRSIGDVKPKLPIDTNGVKEEPVEIEDLSDEDYKVFMCNNNWYLLLRLHHILCTRLLYMYETSLKIVAAEHRDRKDRTSSAAMALRLRPQYEVPPEQVYMGMLEMVKDVLDGNLEIGTFEDRLREMFGIEAYKAFTLDKVVTTSVRQLQHIVCDDMPSQVTSMFISECRKGATGGPSASAHRRFHAEQAYLKRAEKCLKEDNCFKVMTLRNACEMTIELIDPDAEDSEENGGNTPTNCLKEEPANGTQTAAAEAQRFSDYLDKYLSSPQLSPSVLAKLSRKPVFLERNVQACMKKSRISDSHIEDNTQCRFNLSNFKMVFVVNSDSCIFKKAAFFKARMSHKSVSKRMKTGFAKWHDIWCKENVSAEEEQIATDWFGGQIEGLRPNTTILNKIKAVDRPPYQSYNKYTSEKLS